MREDYKVTAPTQKIDIDFEKGVADALTAMEKQTKLTRSEIVNTALKRFITQHRDFLPSDYSKEVRKS